MDVLVFSTRKDEYSRLFLTSSGVARVYGARGQTSGEATLPSLFPTHPPPNCLSSIPSFMVTFTITALLS